MKKLFAGILSACMICALLSGCAKKEPSPATRLDEIKSRGTLTVATEPYFAPEEFIDPSKEGSEQYVGSDIELAKYIADKLGVKLEIVPLDFTTVLSSVTEGKYDLAISALAFKPDRAENMYLSDAYFVPQGEDTGYGFCVPVSLADSVKTVADIADKTVVVQQGSLQQFLWEQYGGPCKEVKYVSSTNDAFLAVSEGKADVVITAASFANNYIAANSDCGLVLQDFRFDVEDKYLGEVIGMKKGEDALLAEINSILAELSKAGTYYDWYAQYYDYAANLRDLGLLEG